VQECNELYSEQFINAGQKNGIIYCIAKKLIEKLRQQQSYIILIMGLDSGMKYAI
ncbi:cysteine synthase family protein, partial [Francisella tularensis]|nr:cysteine synthase family protein [Francisella tularensis]